MSLSPTGLGLVNPTGLKLVKPLRSYPVAGSGKWARKIGDAAGAAFAILECAIERGEELEPSLDSGVVVPHFAHAFQCLVVREYSELGAPKVAAKAFESPDDAASLQINRCPMPLRVERSSADVRGGFCGASVCSCSRAAPNPSMQASQYT